MNKSILYYLFRFYYYGWHIIISVCRHSQLNVGLFQRALFQPIACLSLPDTDRIGSLILFMGKFDDIKKTQTIPLLSSLLNLGSIERWLSGLKMYASSQPAVPPSMAGLKHRGPLNSGAKHQAQLGVRMQSLHVVLLEQGFCASSCSALWHQHTPTRHAHTSSRNIGRCIVIRFSDLSFCNNDNWIVHNFLWRTSISYIFQHN